MLNLRVNVLSLITFILIYSSVVYTQPCHALGNEDKPNIVFIIPADEGFHFWDSEINFAKAVAQTHGFELNIVHTPRKYRNRFDVVNFVKNTLDGLPTSPDLVITSFWLGSEQKMLAMLSEKNIPTITINSSISAEQLSILGNPREKYPLWLGHISPDDVEVGEQLGELLISHAKQQKQCSTARCKVDLFAITGLNYSAVSIQRVDGLKKALIHHRWSSLINVVYGNWKRETVADMMSTVTTRHPHIDAYWVASDIMAYGIRDGLEKLNMTLPEDTLVGSIDWSAPTVGEIRQGHIDFSLGGHFMEAGWALMLFADYQAGIDFKQDVGTIITTPFSVLKKSNIDSLGTFLSAPEWSSNNLSQYSKSLNPSLKTYSLSPLNIINSQIAHNKNR
jgi:ABC-type sugar transport system substrate-binding protein